MKGPDSGGDEISDLNVIPFIDITLVLLIIVIMSSAKPKPDDVDITVPTSIVKSSADINLATTMSISKEGDYYFADQPTKIESKNLFTFLRTVQSVNGGSWPLLLIKTDKETPYGHIANLIQCAQALGVKEISLAVEKKE
ncbi:MAG: hypothetical protein COA79_14820 [Planctomycetota bacterium]|nr:MAG: hypothetical protein COA79_14820 [Planctomycetota bacterium]